MIRPVLYVDLPGIIYALDRRMRANGRSFANFITSPDFEELHNGPLTFLANLFPLRPASRTWISEDHWRLLGVAQARERARTHSWEITYLGSLTHHEANPADVYLELLECALNSAMMHGMHRVFAHASEDPEHLALYQRAGFQIYARDLLYVRLHAQPAASKPEKQITGISHYTIRRYASGDAWDMMRLHDATTPRRVQFAEMLSSDELAQQLVPRQRTWHLPWLEPRDESYIFESGAKFGAWVRFREGWSGLPHQIWIKVHPDMPEVAQPSLDFILQRVAQLRSPESAPVICHARDYDQHAINVLRQAGFEHTATQAILVRHLTLRAWNERHARNTEHSRMNYGVKGLGSIQSVPIESTREILHATIDHRRSRSAPRIVATKYQASHRPDAATY